MKGVVKLLITIILYGFIVFMAWMSVIGFLKTLYGC